MRESSLPAHQTTTRHLGAAYPFASEPGFGPPGVYIGRDLFGGPFVFDPFDLYRRGFVTNPNMVVFGQIGRGKSSFVKSYLWRQAAFGRRAWVVDPKGEYGALARAAGVRPITLRPGGDVRLNPLEAPGPARGSGESDPESSRRRSELLAALASSSLGRALTPGERAAIDVAVAEVGQRHSRVSAPTIPEVVDALLDPSERAARELRTDVASLAAEGRPVALELRRLVAGDLRGMFDGPTSPGVQLDGPLVVLDLSAVYRSAALGILLPCAAAWLHSLLTEPGASDGSEPALLVVDEAWAILANVGVARWLQSVWKLSRALGVANIAVLHRISDLEAAGAAGSEQAGIAQGLLSDSETRVLYAQSHGEVSAAAGLLGLTETEQEILPRLGRAVALWKVGSRSFLVGHRLSPMERDLVDTDVRMNGSAGIAEGA